MSEVFLPGDFDSRLWRCLSRRLNDDLAKARADLESQAMDERPEGAIRLRARISLIKAYLRLPDEAADAERQSRGLPPEPVWFRDEFAARDN